MAALDRAPLGHGGGRAAVVAVAQVAMLPFAIATPRRPMASGWIGRIPRAHRIATTVIEWGASNLYRRATQVEGLVGGCRCSPRSCCCS